MRKAMGILLLGLALSAAVAGCAMAAAVTQPNVRAGGAIPESAVGAPAITWLSGYDAGLKQARVENKPMLLYFHATWCVFCKKMDTEVFPTVEVSQIVAQHFVPVKVDIDQRENATFIAKFMVRGTPTFVIVNGQEEVLAGKGGKPSGYFIGAMDKQEFLEFLNAFVER